MTPQIKEDKSMVKLIRLSSYVCITQLSIDGTNFKLNVDHHSTT